VVHVLRICLSLAAMGQIESDDFVGVQDVVREAFQSPNREQLRAPGYEKVSRSLDVFEQLSEMDSLERSSREIFIPDVPRFEQEVR
jgi:hypothetical protein